MEGPNSRDSGAPTMRRRARAQAVDLSEISLVKESTLGPDVPMPLIIEPAMEGVDLVAWARENSEYLDRQTLERGAILFRGFETNLDVFEGTAAAVSNQLFANYGDLPQEQQKESVYHSTPYPEDEMIDFHNESSHFTSWPEKQFFMCVKPSEVGGLTPIADCRKVYQALSPEIRDKFHEKGLLYIRNFIPNLDVAWQDFFQTEDKAVVEQKCRDAGAECKWKDGDRLQVSNRAPGVIKHPRTGELVFFNQVRLHHVSCLPEAYRESTLSMFAEEDLPRNVVYGDGTPIPDEEVEAVRVAFEDVLVEAPWQAGDMLMLNNMLVAHARRPFKGTRKIVVAMADLWKAEDVVSQPEG